MENKLITIATFPDALKAQIMRGRLAAEGITAFIADEHTLTNQPYLYMAYSGVRLQVAEPDQERSLKIILAQEPLLVDTAPDPVADQCPNCHSSKVKEISATANHSILTVLRNLLTSRSQVTQVRRFSCDTCGYKWIVEN